MNNPEKWFISYTYAVPGPLLKYKDLHPRKIERFKVYKGINSLAGEERLKFAKELRDAIEVSLKLGQLNPFDEELSRLVKVDVVRKERAVTSHLSETDKRRLMPVGRVMALFIESRKDRGLEQKTVDQYQSAVDWMIKDNEDQTISSITYIQIHDRLQQVARAASWTNHSINNQFRYINTGFIWATDQDYLIKNPLEGKIKSLKTSKSIHRWYDRETAVKVKAKLATVPWLLNVCQFTYWIMIRSKKELQQIKIGDIDFDLQQIKFRKEWTKNDTDQNRDYTPEFAEILKQMNLHNLPKDWYIFGTGGIPGPKRVGPNWFTVHWATLRDQLGLSSDYTLYGWKHTRIVHLMMLKIDSYEISHLARHGDSKTTEDYKRDYQISLAKIYTKEDLTF